MVFRPHTLSTMLLVLAVGRASAGDAGREEASCDSNKAPASLLQKVVKNDGKATITQEQLSSLEADGSQPDLCTGIKAQGKCWYLSEMAESCAATCKRYGQSFSYAIANVDDPITPKLVGHIPAVKQEPWAALECYAPSEDRYHPANVNAAKHHEEDHVEAWTHENCKLACPCAGKYVPPAEVPVPTVPATVPADDSLLCSFKQPPACAPEFMYKGVTYSGCASVDSEHGKPWCQHHYQHTEAGPGAPQDWSYCDYSCVPQTVPVSDDDGCTWTPAVSCVKEFDYEGTHYVGCTSIDHDTPWCSNSSPYQGSWNHCLYSCVGNQEKVDEMNKKILADDTLCYWKPREDCPVTFEYKGIEYSGCTNRDHPTPWCSHDRIHKGSWTTCQKVCTQPSGQVTTTASPPLEPTPTKPVPKDDDTPCARHPESENDSIGLSVTLDEAGYKIAAAADSPINMKRFICRTVSKINCVVTDLPSLMAFVPYYSGLVSHQTFQKLESELTTLCHTGGKWVEPLPEKKE